MPLASKILAVCVLVVALAFVWLSASVLEARKNWDTKVKGKTEEVVKVEKEVDALIYGTDDFRAAFKQDVADEVLKLGSPAALAEFNAKFDAGYDARLAFQAAMNLFVAPNVIDAFQKAIKDLNDIQKAPIPDEIQLEAAVRAYDAAQRDMAAALKNLDDAYAIFLGQAPGKGGIRGLSGKGMSIEALRQTVEHFRQIIYAQRTIFEIMLSDGQKNETLVRNLWLETQFEADTMQKTAAKGQEELEDRTKEVEDLKVKNTKEEMDLAAEIAKRDKAIADLADLTARYKAVLAKTQQLAARLKVKEIEFDQQRGIKTAVITENGLVPKGRVQKVNDENGTAEIDIGYELGVKSGRQLHVYRWIPEAKYLGIMEIIEAKGNSSTGRMLPEYRQITIQPNDIVSPEITRPTSSETN
jgi:hypothetical protein